MGKGELFLVILFVIGIGVLGWFRRKQSVDPTLPGTEEDHNTG